MMMMTMMKMMLTTTMTIITRKPRAIASQRGTHQISRGIGVVWLFSAETLQCSSKNLIFVMFSQVSYSVIVVFCWWIKMCSVPECVTAVQVHPGHSFPIYRNLNGYYAFYFEIHTSFGAQYESLNNRGITRSPCATARLSRCMCFLSQCLNLNPALVL